ncbi:hypothetical protein ACSQIV_004846, partial [Salmonella enterica subsp. enterica serovar Schwarzengrund]
YAFKKQKAISNNFGSFIITPYLYRRYAAILLNSHCRVNCSTLQISLLFLFLYQKAALLFVTKSKKAFSLMSSIAVHPEPAALPTHGLMSRRSTWLNYIQSYPYSK